MTSDADCLYVTCGWGIHDERWVEALRTLGHRPEVLAMTVDTAPDVQNRSEVITAVERGLPVLAGPLHSITRPLVGIPTHLVGLSWGYDLHDLQRASDTAWLAHLDGLIVDSLATRDIAIAAGVAAERITLLPWGIDLEAFTRTGTKAEFDVPSNTRIILSLRAHEDRYRVGEIIRAFAALSTGRSDVALVIGHSGSGTDRLRHLAADLGILDRTRFIGTVSEPELAPLLRSATCYVTAAEVDGTSVTLLQAMACGTPVVASATPGNLEWIDDQVTGRTFTVGDVPGLVDAMTTILDADPNSLTEAAHRLVEERADWRRNISRLETALFPNLR